MHAPSAGGDMSRATAAGEALASMLRDPDRPVEKWLVWSNEHRAWWRPNWQGYTVMLDQAGRYSKDEASAICERAGWVIDGIPPEIPVRESDVINLLVAPWRQREKDET